MSEPNAESDTSVEESGRGSVEADAVPDTLPTGASSPEELADTLECIRTKTISATPQEAIQAGLVTVTEFEPDHAHYAAGHRFEAQLFEGAPEKLAHLRGWGTSGDVAVANLLDAVKSS